MLVYGNHYRTIWMEGGSLKIIDQRKLPHSFEIEILRTVEDVFSAIKDMHVRGAPLIGVCAAYGMHLACKEGKDFHKAGEYLKSARPTAIDLMWAVDKVISDIEVDKEGDKVSVSIRSADRICEESVSMCKRIGEHGLKIIEEIYQRKKAPVNILTHCNAGWLATVDYGTATSPIYHAKEKGIPIHVWVDETRPRNQGFLTAWELKNEGIPHTIIADNTGGHLMQHGMVDMVIVGSDRTTSMGDVTNKIGTYLKALAAKDNDVPFYAALPSSTIDWTIKDAKKIPIEKRSSDEMDYICGVDEHGHVKRIRITPESEVANFAFDVTPARLVTGIITEKGIAAPDRLSSMYFGSSEGYVKFDCRLIRKDITREMDDRLFLEIERARHKLWKAGLIGMNEKGIGFGNISMRHREGFMISGTATGKKEHLLKNDLVKVTHYDVDRNSVSCEGELSASSESLSNAVIFETVRSAGAVIHVHSEALWNSLKGKCPETPADCEYGTPEIARSVKRALKDPGLSKKLMTNLIIMLGHENGILAYGKDVDEVADILIRELEKTRKLSS